MLAVHKTAVGHKLVVNEIVRRSFAERYRMLSLHSDRSRRKHSLFLNFLQQPPAETSNENENITRCHCSLSS